MSTIDERFKAKKTTSFILTKQSRGLDERIIAVIQEKLKPGMTLDDITADIEQALREEINKILSVMANGTAKDIQLIRGVSVTKAEMDRISAWYINRFKENFNSNTLWSYEKIRNKYGDLISIIRDSAMRDRMYLTDDLADVKRFYLDKVTEILGNDNLTADGRIKTTIRSVAVTINEQLQDVGKQRHAYSILNTQMLNVYRESNVVIAEKAGFKHAIYTGVLQARSRDFCIFHLGAIKTIEEWESMDNDIGDHNVMEKAGGYNCDHEAMPIDMNDSQETQSIVTGAYGETEAQRREYVEKLREAKRNTEPGGIE